MTTGSPATSTVKNDSGSAIVRLTPSTSPQGCGERADKLPGAAKDFFLFADEHRRVGIEVRGESFRALHLGIHAGFERGGSHGEKIAGSPLNFKVPELEESL